MLERHDPIIEAGRAQDQQGRNPRHDEQHAVPPRRRPGSVYGSAAKISREVAID
jgi:hypothetical protein